VVPDFGSAARAAPDSAIPVNKRRCCVRMTFSFGYSVTALHPAHRATRLERIILLRVPDRKVANRRRRRRPATTRTILNGASGSLLSPNDRDDGGGHLLRPRGRDRERSRWYC
jgi:hypothetical protein